MTIQRGVNPAFYAGEDIEDAIDANGVGKAVIYNVGTDQEVLEGTEDDYADFAGVIITVDAEATITREDNFVHNGARNVKDGDMVGLENDGFVMVNVSDAVNFGDFLTTDDDGEFQKITVSTTDAQEVMKIVGRALGTIDKAGAVKAHIWVRK